MQLDRVLQVLGVGEGRSSRQVAPPPAPGSTRTNGAPIDTERIAEELAERATVERDRPKAPDAVLVVRTHDRPSFRFSDYATASGGYGKPER